jgi:hypothetical protein
VQHSSIADGDGVSEQRVSVVLPFLMSACWASMWSAILVMALTRFALGN